MTISKIRVPDGHGGWMEVDGEITQGSMANTHKQAEALQSQLDNEAHEHMVKVLQFEQTRSQEMNLAAEQRAFAMLLLVISMRERFPKGTDVFDKINEAAYNYYLKNS